MPDPHNSSTMAGARILVLRLGAMGDIIHALPAVAAIRRAQPDAEIGWVIEERWIELLATREAAAGPRSPQKPLVDRIHTVNTRGWRSALVSEETWKEMMAAVRGLRAERYDVALDFQGAWKSGLIAGLSGAGSRVGFRQPRERGASLFYTQMVDTRRAHVIEQNFELVKHAGFALNSAVNGPSLSTGDLFPHEPQVAAWCDSTLLAHRLPSPGFAVMNPGAGWGAKQWPVEKYAEVARFLAEDGVRTVVNFSPAEEPLARQLEALSGGAAVAISCTIGELVELMRRASLFVGGDTGPMHLAAALGVPVVGIFGPTDPARNGPFATESIVLRRVESVTNHSRRGAPDEAMLSITATEVQEAAHILLRRTVSGRPSLTPEAPDA